MTDPFYEDELTTLYVADCIRETRWLDADVLVTDPPYGIGYISNFGIEGPTEPILGDQDTGLRDKVLALWGPTKPAIVFGTWRAPRPPGVRALVIWHKGDTPGMGDLSLPWGPSHEEFYVIGGYGPEHWTGKREPSVIRSRNREGNATGRVDHPTPKPIFLMQRIISKINPAYTIADPFAGSGSTLVAAKMLGRKSIGIEIDPNYAAIAARRLERIQ